jgi:hypothetical protein
MGNKQKAILLGPFVGELYWECGRFAPLLPNMVLHKYKGQDIKYIVFTREDRFDLYGKFADILVPLRIEGDYINKKPECYRLIGLKNKEYNLIAKKFYNQYKDRYNIVKHIYPDVTKPAYTNKNQYHKSVLSYVYKPRKENYRLVDEYLPKDGKPIVVLAPRFRKGFKRNWNGWEDFYNLLYKDKNLMENFHFIICGKEGEYIPDKKSRFLDMNEIEIGKGSSLVGLLLAIMKRAYFTFGSQSAIPNISLLFKVDVLEFGCQKKLHTKTYNITNTPITFIENRNYNLEPQVALKHLKKLLNAKKESEK